MGPHRAADGEERRRYRKTERRHPQPDPRRRTVLDSVMELRQVQEHGNGRIAAIEATLDRFAAGMEELRQAQKHTDEKLNTLIDTIDRMIPNRGNGQQT